LGSVLLTRRIPSSVLSRLQQTHDVDVHHGDAGLPHDELLRRVADKEALITVFTDWIDGSLMDAASRLRVIANVGVGYDHIDVAAARARGIVVTNTPDVLTEATAELTWALILGIARRVAEGDRLIRAGRWKGWAPDFMIGTELRGKQLGIVGAGRIGRAVAAKAPAFGMTVAFATRGKGPREPGMVSLDELLVTSDVVSVHAPLTPETRHLIDRKALVRMKRSALLVNTARGPLVDEEALAWALGERLIAGAALDVFEREPEVHAALLTMENVLVVPHVGSATRETRAAMADLAVSNVLAVLAGDPPLTAV
jgi:glyoxylate reductase